MYFENNEIARLGKIIERLIKVSETNLLEMYNKKCGEKINSLTKTEKINALLSLNEFSTILAKAKQAQDLFFEAVRYKYPDDKKYLTIEKFLRSAAICRELICELSASDTKRVLCEVIVSKSTTQFLKNALYNPNLKPHAELLLKFINEDAPANVWSDAMENFTRGKKVFLVAETEEDFEGLLKSGYTEITYVKEFGGIRIAFAKETACMHTQQEKYLYDSDLKKILDCSLYANLYRPGIDIIYPDTEYIGNYYIYIP